MKVQATKLGRRLPHLLVAILGFATSSFAAQMATMTLTGVGTNGALGGAYIGPYVGTINTVTTPLICDDFFDDSYIPESWTADVYSISNFASDFGNSTSPSALTGYEEVAWLSQQLTDQSSGQATYLACPVGDNCAGDIQYAIWAVFDPAALGEIGGTDLKNANAWLSAAQSQYSTGNYSNVSIYTPDSHYSVTCGGASCPSAPPQEFIVVRTPEPPVLAVLGIDLSAIGVLIFFFRRKLTTN